MWWRAYTLFESLLLVDINTITGLFYFYLSLLHPKNLIFSSSVFPLFCPSFIMTCSASSLIMYLSFFSVFWNFSCICPCCFTLDKKAGTIEKENNRNGLFTLILRTNTREKGEISGNFKDKYEVRTNRKDQFQMSKMKRAYKQ